MVLSAVAAGVVVASGSSAGADVVCGVPYGGPVGACATVTEDSVDVRASSSTAPGGATGATVTSDSATVWADGNESNGETLGGWVVVVVDGEGADVDCGTTEAPDDTGCEPSP